MSTKLTWNDNKYEALKPRIDRIRLLLFDVDGVLTRGDIILGNHDEELKFFDIQDGMGVTLARWGGLKVGVITGRTSKVVEKRCRELKMDVVSQGAFNKIPAYEEIIDSFSVTDDEVCYMGDDLLDLAILERVGLPATPQNGRSEIKNLAAIVTEAEGGRGAVRELVEIILKTQGKWDAVVERARQAMD